MTAMIQTRSRHSPCIGICKLDEATGLCLGCARSGDEIGSWASLSEAGRDAIWAKLPERLKTLAVRVYLLPLMGNEIRDWAADTISARRGTWVIGAPGATAELPCLDGRDIAVEAVDDVVIARAHDARFRLRVTEKVRAFAFAADGPVVLGFPRGRVTLGTETTVTALGEDANAVDQEHRGQELFDLGVARRASRFCVRTGDPELIATLRAFCGRSYLQLLSEAGAQLIARNPTRVVETELARVEVFSPIPAPGGNSAGGAHTHLLPQFLATGEEIPSALALPDYAAPLGIFYPGKPPA